MPSGKTHLPGPLSEAIGRILSDAISSRPVTQVQVAEMAGMSETQFSRTLRGLKVFTLEQLDSVCRALDLSLTEVVSHADNESRAARLALTLEQDEAEQDRPVAPVHDLAGRRPPTTESAELPAAAFHGSKIRNRAKYQDDSGFEGA